MIGLEDLLRDYVETGSRRGFKAWARKQGWRVVVRPGVVLAYQGSRLVAFTSASPSEGEREVSLMPCATCGALPVGSFWHRGRLSADEARRYACGPHEPIWPSSERGGGRRHHASRHPRDPLDEASSRGRIPSSSQARRKT